MKEIENARPAPVRTFLLHMVVGIVIGIGGILPGVSGGVMAVSLGLYRPMIDAVAGFFKSPRRNFLFLLPIFTGAVLGFLLGAAVLSRLMGRWETQIMWLFLGLVAGGVPSFLREANERGFKWRYLIATVLGAALSSLMLFLDRTAGAGADAAALTPIPALISGAIVALGVAFPGVSTAFILMYLGWYRPMMDAFATLNVLPIIFLGIGSGACALATIKAARWLFDRFHGYAYYAVLGFLLTSAALIFPGFPGTLPSDAACLSLAALGALAAWALGSVEV